jgi:SAM-dependent methyltransferase
MAIGAARDYYERYWSASEGAPPDTDPLTESRVKLFLRYSEGRRGTLLDAGCGGGRAMSLLADAGYQVTGIDISLGALGKARARSLQAIVVAGVVDSALPFADCSFDAVLSCEVIEHLLDVPGFLSELNRVLRPGGSMFLSTPYHGLMKNLVLSSLCFEKHFDPEGAHIRFFTPKSLSRTVERSGFRLKRFSFLGRFWPLWMNMLISAEKI